MMTISIRTLHEADGRWIAEIPELPGVMVYDASEAGAIAKVKALALRVVADRLEHGGFPADFAGLHFHPAA
jgi:predicted RNase H-like HicB family nuclease